MCSFIDIFGYPLSSYGLMVAVGVLVCIAYAYFQLKKRPEINYIYLIFATLWIGLGVFVGSHILYGITNISKFVKLFEHFEEIFADFFVGMSIVGSLIGGMVFYGGLIGGAIALVVYLKATKKDVRAYCDFLVPCIPLFHIFGRIGCFLSGCCYGIESHIGFTYTDSIVTEANGVTRLPLPLIEAFFNLLIFLFLLYLYNKHKLTKGHMIIAYALTYPVVRFVDEFFRGDEIRGFWGPFSTSQWISIIIFAAALIYVVIAKTKGVKLLNKKA